MQRSLRLSLSLSGVAALALSNGSLLSAAAQDVGGAEDLGVMEINLMDVVNQVQLGFSRRIQGAGIPNQAGIGGFLPIAVGENSVFFEDVLANVNFADYGNDSSLINTEVAGTTISSHQGEQLTTYSFRHRYAKGMHAANVPIANISEAMGHTIEVHLGSYARFKPNATADIIAAVNV